MTTTETPRTDATATEARRPGANLRVAAACAVVFLGMVGLSFASVPLYDLFCKVTGYGGTTQVADGIEGVPVLDREINVRFDANVAPGLPWEFRAEERQVRMRLGEVRTIAYTAHNTSDVATTGTSTYNVTPDATGSYFSKVACFCFTEQEIGPGESVEMAVTFYVDPAILEDDDTRGVPTITLSYTFFPAARPGERETAATAAPPTL
jgi:cytochrome c oxidase assembly protein subunit 11